MNVLWSQHVAKEDARTVTYLAGHENSQVTIVTFKRTQGIATVRCSHKMV